MYAVEISNGLGCLRSPLVVSTDERRCRLISDVLGQFLHWNIYSSPIIITSLTVFADKDIELYERDVSSSYWEKKFEELKECDVVKRIGGRLDAQGEEWEDVVNY